MKVLEEKASILAAEIKEAAVDTSDSVRVLQESVTKLGTLRAQIEQLKRRSARGEDALTLLATTAFDVWSFGVVMYEMCTGMRLFSRNNDDNLVLKDQQVRLATWHVLNEEEKSLVLKECDWQNVDESERELIRAAACELLDKCLHPDPTKRPTMKTVLELAFFSGRAADMQLSLSNQAEFRRDMRRVEQKVDALGDALNEAKVRLFDVPTSVSFTILCLRTRTQAARIKCIQASLLRGMLSVSESEYPALFILVPPGMVHLIPSSKGQHDLWTKAEMKLCDVYFLCIVCQLTGRVMHSPVKLHIPSAKVRGFLKLAAGPMKVTIFFAQESFVSISVWLFLCLPFSLSNLLSFY
jgi:hypothetical protein